VGNKPLLKAGKVVDHRNHLLDQRAASKTKLLHKTENQTANCNKTQIMEEEGGAQHAPEKRGREKK
jgi:hypothetical protein